MKKLADISAFEGLQGQANAGFVSDASVFNRSTRKPVKNSEEDWDDVWDEDGEIDEDKLRRSLDHKGIDYYEFTVPTWAIMYLEYEGDPDDYDLTDEEAAWVDEFRDQIGGKYTICPEEYFSKYPEFGLPTQCVTIISVAD